VRGSSPRGPPTRLDFGGELLYQFSQDVDFNGGSKAELDDDLGLALSFTYRFNSRFELLFGLDWNSCRLQRRHRAGSDLTGRADRGNGLRHRGARSRPGRRVSA
jgi:hypothetical protein